MRTFLQQLRFGARLAARKPGITAISVLTLGVGIGLTTTMFSIVYGALMSPLPFEQPDRLVGVLQTNVAQTSESMNTSLHDFEVYREQDRVFEGLASYSVSSFNIGRTEGARRYSGALVTANAFDVLRARPVLGRGFLEEEDAPGAEPVVVIGYRVWQDLFRGDPRAVGQTLRINGEETIVIGVMGEGFTFPDNQDLWMPDQREAMAFERGAPAVPYPGVFGRLRPGVSLDQADAQVRAGSLQLAGAYPETNEDVRASVVPLRKYFNRWLGPQVAPLLFVMLGGVFAVLLIACVNVANLLLAQAALRSREVAVRTALGASRARIAAQFLTEALVLAVAGAALGLWLAAFGSRLFESAVPTHEASFWMNFGIDGTILLFVLALAVFCTLAAGLIPAVRASGREAGITLREESRGASSFRLGRVTRALVVGELVLAVVLLAGAGLMIKNVVQLTAAEYPFGTEDVLAGTLLLPAHDQRYDAAGDRIAFFADVDARLRAEPAFRDAGLVSSLPGLGAGTSLISIEGEVAERARDEAMAPWASATAGFFQAVGSPILQGRNFLDEESMPVAIVNAEFARRHFPDGDALGRRMRFGGVESESTNWRTIVGIVPDLYLGGFFETGEPGFYIPVSQTTGPRFMNLVARTQGPPQASAPRLRAVVAGVDADIALYDVDSLAGRLHGEMWPFRVFGALFTIMGAVALFLGAIGLYGVISFSVSRRTREMGVRMALGADARGVVRLVMRQGMIQIAMGLGLGLLAALAATRLLGGVLVDVSPRDPAVFGAIVLVLAGAGLLATYLPARRATRVDPMTALRAD
jgi:putative ABC transport system permease protein